jgi:hypothetical protein
MRTLERVKNINGWIIFTNGDYFFICNSKEVLISEAKTLSEAEKYCIANNEKYFR